MKTRDKRVLRAKDFFATSGCMYVRSLPKLKVQRPMLAFERFQKFCELLIVHCRRLAKATKYARLNSSVVNRTEMFYCAERTVLTWINDFVQQSRWSFMTDTGVSRNTSITDAYGNPKRESIAVFRNYKLSTHKLSTVVNGSVFIELEPRLESFLCSGWFRRLLAKFNPKLESTKNNKFYTDWVLTMRIWYDAELNYEIDVCRFRATENIACERYYRDWSGYGEQLRGAWREARFRSNGKLQFGQDNQV